MPLILFLELFRLCFVVRYGNDISEEFNLKESSATETWLIRMHDIQINFPIYQTYLCSYSLNG